MKRRNARLPAALGLAVVAAALAPALPARAADPAPAQASPAKPSPAQAAPTPTPAPPPAAAPPAPAAPDAEPPVAAGGELEGTSEAPKKKTPPYAPPPGWGAPEMQMPILPRRLDYEEGDPILPEYQIKTKADRGLVVSGLVTALVPYGISALFGAAFLGDGGRQSETIGPMLVPFAGPFITIAVSSDDPNDRPLDEISTYFLMLDGFAQIAGAAMFATGMLLPDKYLERTAKLPGKPEIFIGGTSASVKLHF